MLKTTAVDVGWNDHRRLRATSVRELSEINQSLCALQERGIGQTELSTMWSDTVGLRTRPVSDQKKLLLVLVLVLHTVVLILILVLQAWCCVVHQGLITLVVNNDLEGYSNFSSIILQVLGTLLLWRSTVAFTYLKVKSAKCFRLLPVVLILVLFLRIWSCLHHW